MSSPAVDSGVVFFGCEDGAVYAVNAASGTLKWKYSSSDIFEDVAPTVDSGVVYIGSVSNGAGNLYALSEFNGTVAWEYHANEFIRSSVAVSNGIVYFGSDTVYALSVINGSVEWIYHGGGVFANSSPDMCDSDTSFLYLFAFTLRRRSVSCST